MFHCGGTDAFFRNNIYDVAFSPYENHQVNQPGVITANRSKFRRCSFLTQGPLNKPGLAPKDHALLPGVRGIQFSNLRRVSRRGPCGTP